MKLNVCNNTNIYTTLKNVVSLFFWFYLLPMMCGISFFCLFLCLFANDPDQLIIKMNKNILMRSTANQLQLFDSNSLYVRASPDNSRLVHCENFL